MTAVRDLSRRESAPGTAAVLIAWGGALLFAVSLGYFLFCYLVRFGQPAAGESFATPTLANLGLFTAFAFHHSLMARSGAKVRVRQLAPPCMERSLYTWISSALFIAVCAFWQPVPGVLYVATGPWAVLGYAVQLGGIVVTSGGARAIDALDLAGVRPVLLARAGARPRHVPLETSGVYRFVRHPVYLAWTLFVFGTPAMTGTRAVFAIVSTAYLALAIPLEERGLLETFGDEYRTYQRQVRWRMIPGVY